MPSASALRILNEVKLGLRALLEKGEEKVIYLSRLPLTEEDFQSLQETLGSGAVVVWAQGTDATVWRETSFPGAWWGQYRDGADKVALRTIEIAPFPQLARAQAEDISLGLERSKEL